MTKRFIRSEWTKRHEMSAPKVVYAFPKKVLDLFQGFEDRLSELEMHLLKSKPDIVTASFESKEEQPQFKVGWVYENGVGGSIIICNNRSHNLSTGRKWELE